VENAAEMQTKTLNEKETIVSNEFMNDKKREQHEQKNTGRKREEVG
jgi:hypothetical protein